MYDCKPNHLAMKKTHYSVGSLSHTHTHACTHTHMHTCIHTPTEQTVLYWDVVIVGMALLDSVKLVYIVAVGNKLFVHLILVIVIHRIPFLSSV